MRARTWTAVAAVLALVATGAPTAVAAAGDLRSGSPPPTVAPAAGCDLLPGVRRGEQAVDELGDDLPTAAVRAGMTVRAYTRTLRTDHRFRVDRCGRTFVVDSARTPAGRDHAAADPDEPRADAALSTSGDAFALNSRPGSQRTIYLDFDGATISGTVWNTSYNGGAAWVAPAFSADADPATFNAAEQATVKDVWLRVAEDYAPFDVNVTTAVPDPAALARSSSSDLVYGATALITNDSLVYGQCGCGGVAYVGVFDTTGSNHEVYQPAFVFQRGLGTGAKNIAEATSHEVGHNLGLAHDGTATAGYYSGQGSWAPIMGVGYSKPVTQFSSGEYTSANNTQDDFAVAASNGASIVTDDHADSASTTSSLSPSAAVDGVVSTATDSDWFRFSASGSTTVTVTPQATGPNLDTKLEIRVASGTLVASADPPVATVNSSTASGLGAQVTFPAAAGTYYAVVDGTGWGDPAGTGYSGYGSRGRYQVSLATTPVAPVTITTNSLPRGTAGQAYQVNLAATGGTEPYTWTIASGALPSGVTLSSGGVLSGTPSTAGTATVRFTAVDAVGTSATSASLTLAVDPAAVEPVSVTTGSLPAATAGQLYSATLAATGGTAPYSWSVVAGALPAGLTLTPTGMLAGTPAVAGTSSFTVRAQDADGGSATRSLQLTVAAAPVPVSVTTSSLATGVVGRTYSATLAATGGTAPYAWSVVAGALPAGLTLTPTGMLAGTPAVAGTSSFTVRAQDADGGSATRSLQLTVAAAPVPVTVTTAALPTAYRGTSYSVALTATGGTPPYTWRVTSGWLPNGLRLSSSGVISGRPTSAQTRTFTVRATDGLGLTASRSLTIRVLRPVAVTTVALPTAYRGQGYLARLAADGGTAPYRWQVVAGTLPTGMARSASGWIIGRPATVGTATVTVLVTDARGRVALRALRLTVAQPLTVTTTALPVARHGMRYLRRLQAVGVVGAATWRVSAGRLPAGLRLTAAGVVTGRPRVAQTRRFSVRCSNGGHSASRTYRIVVR